MGEQSYYSSHSKTKSTVIKSKSTPSSKETDDEESDEDEGGGFFSAILDMCADCGFTGGDNEITKKEKSQYSTRSRTNSHNRTRFSLLAKGLKACLQTVIKSVHGY